MPLCVFAEQEEARETLCLSRSPPAPPLSPIEHFNHSALLPALLSPSSLRTHFPLPLSNISLLRREATAQRTGTKATPSPSLQVGLILIPIQSFSLHLFPL